MDDNLVVALDGYRATAKALYFVADVVNNLDDLDEDVASVSCVNRLVAQLDSFHGQILDAVAIHTT